MSARAAPPTQQRAIIGYEHWALLIYELHEMEYPNRFFFPEAEKAVRELYEHFGKSPLEASLMLMLELVKAYDLWFTLSDPTDQRQVRKVISRLRARFLAAHREGMRAIYG